MAKKKTGKSDDSIKDFSRWVQTGAGMANIQLPGKKKQQRKRGK